MVVVTRVEATDVQRLERLRRLAISTFIETYHPPVPLPPLQLHCDVHFAPEQLARDAASPDVALFLLEQGELTLGYLKVVRGQGVCVLERSYLATAFQGQGLGDHLMTSALAQARRWEASVIQLRVWHLNARALRFYERWRFVKTGEAYFEVELDDGTTFRDLNHVLEAPVLR